MATHGPFRRASALSILFCLVLFASAGSAEPLYRFAPVPSWVLPGTPDYDASPPETEGPQSEWILLFDRQFRVNTEGYDRYQHEATRLLNEVGVGEWSQIDLGVDPSYQSLDLHFVRIVRGKAVLDALKTARISALPVETRIQESIYDGSYNVNLLLSDVRPGDIVECAYTVRSCDRLSPTHFAGKLTTGWATPIHWQRIRLTAPAARTLRVRMSDDSPVPPFAQRGTSKELELDGHDLAVIPLDNDCPGWYSQLPYLEITDLSGWPDVIRLMRPLYERALGGASGRVQTLAAEIKADGGTPEQQALRALQYVQEQIRYTSIAIGPGGYRPAVPDTVLERRFGDCKDKSVLLVALFRQLGFEAELGLVSTYRGRALPLSYPTPYAFDHVIVRLTIGDKVYWVDGTAPKRSMPLSANDAPDYEQALVLDESETGLTGIPRPSRGSRFRNVLVSLNMSGGIDKPAQMEITTTITGTLADETRSALSQTTPEQRQTDYLNYEARYYPGIKSTAPVEIDENADGIVIREKYMLDSAFVADPSGVSQCMLHADEIYPYVETLGSSSRRSPLALPYPAKLRERITAALPEEWSVTPEMIEVVNPAFRYSRSVTYQKRVLELTYEYEAFADHVDSTALVQYLADRKRAYDDAYGYKLTYRKTIAAESRAAPLPIVAVLLSLALSAWAAFRWGYRFDPEPAAADPAWPSGLKGWLILVAINIVVALVSSLWLPIASAGIFNAAYWREPGWSQVALLAITAGTGPLVAGAVLLTIVFFRKRTSAPRIFIAYWWYLVLYVLVVDITMVALLAEKADWMQFATSTIRNIIVTSCWTAYMLCSRRVRATFRNQLAGEAVSLEEVEEAVR